MSEQAREITEQAMELYRRFAKVLEHLKSTGGSIERVVSEYNKLVGSLKARVIPVAKRLETYAGSELPELGQVEVQPRHTELDGSEDEGGQT